VGDLRYIIICSRALCNVFISTTRFISNQGIQVLLRNKSGHSKLIWQYTSDVTQNRFTMDEVANKLTEGYI
jgi:hypothetical protein